MNLVAPVNDRLWLGAQSPTIRGLQAFRSHRWVGERQRRVVRMQNADEADWLARAQEGDKQAFAKLVGLHQRRVFACAVKMLGHGGDADDAVQECFVRAWRALPRFDGRAKLSTWLHRICVNVCLNHIRKNKRHRASDLNDPSTPEPAADPSQGQNDPAHAFEHRQLTGEIAKAIDGLSESLRTTVVLVLIQGMPQKEAAVLLGCSEGTIAWRVHEARRQLRKRLAAFRSGHGSRSGRRAS